MSKIPTELDRIGRVTIYAGSEERRRLLKALCEWDQQNRSLSELIELAVRDFLKRQGALPSPGLGPTAPAAAPKRRGP